MTVVVDTPGKDVGRIRSILRRYPTATVNSLRPYPGIEVEFDDEDAEDVLLNLMANGFEYEME